MAASMLVVAAVVSTDLAATEGVLLGSWVATSCGTIVLLRAGTRSWRSPIVLRAAATFAIIDGILVAAAVLASSLAATHHSAAAAVLLSAAAVAAAGRAGFSLRSSWVIGTVGTPTSISALLHAGVVNAGALLLIRLEVREGSCWWVAALLGIACMVVMISLAPRIHVRPDLKGQLATSTVAQMAFMFLTLALGFPLLALTHLVGHGLYKAGRFMSAGGAIEARAHRRRLADHGTMLSTRMRVAGVVSLLAVAAGAAALVGGDTWAALGVIGPGAAMVWWVRSARPMQRPITDLLAVVAGLSGYAAILAAAQELLDSSMPPSSLAVPWWTLGLLVGVVAVVSSLGRTGQANGSATIENVPALPWRHIEEVAA